MLLVFHAYSLLQYHIFWAIYFLLEAASIYEIGKKVTISSGAFTPDTLHILMPIYFLFLNRSVIMLFIYFFNFDFIFLVIIFMLFMIPSLMQERTCSTCAQSLIPKRSIFSIEFRTKVSYHYWLHSATILVF